MRNPLIESILDDEGLHFEYLEDVPMSNIDRTKSRANQSRDVPIVKDNVLRMRKAIQHGIELFAPVAYEDRAGKYTLVDGNNRDEAKLMENFTHTDLYVVNTTDQTVRVMLAYMLNPTNGVEPPTEQLATQAVHLQTLGFTTRQVAEKLGVTPTFVGDSRIDTQGHDRAHRLGAGVLTAWDKIQARGTRVNIQRGVSLDSVFEAIVRFAAAFALVQKDVKPLIETLNTLSSESDQLDAVKDAVKAAQRKRAGKTRVGNRDGFSVQTQFKGHMTFINNLKDSAFQGLDAEQRKEALGLIVRTVQHLNELEVQLLGSGV